MIPAVTLHADPLGLLVAFGAGMLSFISPCVLPLVPGYVSMISGMSAAELDALRPIDVSEAATDPGGDVLTLTEVERRTERTRLLRGILLFIAGFTVVFTMLGASASVVGHVLTTHKCELEMLSGILIVAFGTLMVSMAAGIRLPSAVGRERRFAVRPSVLGAWAPPVMGVAFAFAWTPCIGPVLGSVLALAAGTGGTTTGGIALLLAYSIGLGVPFLLFGLAFGRMTDLVGRVRGRLRYVDLVGGIVLIVFGVLLLTGNVDVLSAHISHFLDDLHLSRLSSS